MKMLMAVAWRNLWRHKRRSLITASAMAIALGLCMAIIAFNDGTYAKLFEVMVEQSLGHVQIAHPDYATGKKQFDTVPRVDELLEAVDGLAEAQGAAARLDGFGLIGGGSTSVGGTLTGVLPAREATVTRIEERVQEGRFLSDDAAAEVVLGVGLAKELDIAVGGSVVVLTQSADGSMGNAVYDVVGLSSTGNAVMDRAGAWMHLHDLQDLLVLPDQAHQLTLLSHDPSDLPAFREAVRAVAPEGTSVKTWQETSPQTAEMMGMQTAANAMMLGLVFAVASFGVLNTMMMSVFERTRELGVLKAIGMSPARLVAMIVIESVFLAVIAGAMGLAVGGLLDAYLVNVGFDMSSASPEGIEVMGVRIDPVLYAKVTASSILQPLVALVLVSVFASLYPAFRAARLEPVDAIRGEG